MKESTLKKNCAALIRSRGGWARSIAAGPAMAGMSDCVGCYRGVMLVLEMKLPGKEHTLTRLQADTLAKAKAAGAVARVITRKSQVAALLDAIDKRRDQHERLLRGFRNDRDRSRTSSRVGNRPNHRRRQRAPVDS